ncbi:Helix-turn-helix [Oscillibacter sp. PC13]|uniref:helix-turn-helix domain-containing protein n=1 Tax=Oscillibacter sp. PC13 TaxID=1855299 RepID=UPI0008F100AD|nr:helix-turn-helix transcriptional regulator [Oscillibacter sp. PC13]SFP08297.1 Helix-turn-helix [Oscillibacter sp. PC13]
MTFQERLRELRKEHGETQAEVAASIGIADRHYQKFEAGSNLPSFHNLCALADHFGVSMDYLAGRTERREVAE